MKSAQPTGEHDRHEQNARTENEYVTGFAYVETPNATNEKIAYREVKEAPRTLIVDEDKPSPGGEAKGLWNACPEIPLPKCGSVFARKAPPKKCAT